MAHPVLHVQKQKHTWFLIVTIAALVAMPSHAAPPLTGEDWKLEVVHRTEGRKPLKGLITEVSTTHVHLKRVFRRRGHPTVVLSDRVPRSQVARMERLAPENREKLMGRLDALAKERAIFAARLRLNKGGRITLPPGVGVTLSPASWGMDSKQQALSYESTHFTLISNAREDVVQLTAIQLEQIFAAFVRHLPPKSEDTGRTTIVLTRSLEDYYEYQARLLRLEKPQVLNPAFYHPKSKTVVCGSDLERLSAEIEKVSKLHAELREKIKNGLNRLSVIYGNQVPDELLRPLKQATQRIDNAERKNNELFANSHLRLYQRLHHEAFHAYLDNSASVGNSRSIPIWLNEGLAQVFETAMVEAGELRVGHADPERRKRIQDELRKHRAMPLMKLLKASPREFQFAHAAKQQVSDDYYLTSWGLAFYLTFELQLIGTPQLEAYAKALNERADPVKSFEQLVGKPLKEFERDFHDYLRHLKLDGTVARSR